MRKMKMKAYLPFMFALVAVMACREDEPKDLMADDLTGNETVYPLVQGSDYEITGTVTLRQLKDGGTRIEVTLTGTNADLLHPLHLHPGSIALPGAPIAASLNPVSGKTGKSITNLHNLADESPITYDELISYDGCVKVHLAASGPEKDIVLAGGNIGNLYARESAGGRTGFGICDSE